MRRLLKLIQKLKTITRYKGLYIHWLTRDDVQDITEILPFEQPSRSNDIQY